MTKNKFKQNFDIKYKSENSSILGMNWIYNFL